MFFGPDGRYCNAPAVVHGPSNIPGAIAFRAQDMGNMPDDARSIQIYVRRKADGAIAHFIELSIQGSVGAGLIAHGAPSWSGSQTVTAWLPLVGGALEIRFGPLREEDEVFTAPFMLLPHLRTLLEANPPQLHWVS